MKTPREILLKRHQSANAKLDRLRTEVLSTTLSHPIRALRRDGQEDIPLAVRALLVVWRELIWPCRRAWAGMAALWLVMWGINRGLSDTPKATRSAHTASASALFQALEEQRRLLAELIPAVSSQPAEPPRRNPKPQRSTL
ncbi:MAG: hypothetical protein DME19_14810 [Verrucomicrobia bacterium]|nr:MAG: hypothetical protein DME19_14810 [Verrucomicrobiota bacterium]